MRRLTAAIAAFVLAIGIAGSASAAGLGPPHQGFYIDGSVYRTIGTPTDLTGTGAPDSSFQPLYALDADPMGGLLDVATAAPGDPGFRGGRWAVYAVTWNVAPVQLTSDEQVLAYAANGWISISSEPVKRFECPVIQG
jgi:hypothetical protein